MIPASLTRPARPVMTREGHGLARNRMWRPANIPFAVRAELRSLVVWGGLLGVIGVLFALGYVWVRLKVVEAGYRLSATRQLVERLEVEGRELAVRAAAADAHERLEELAQVRLGMHRPVRGEEASLP
jgi:cell division protein FtsL